MSNALHEAQQLAGQREQKKRAEVGELLNRARQLTVDHVTGKPTKADDFLEVADKLGVGLRYFDDENDGAIARCRRRIADVEGLARIPVLQKEEASLVAKSASVEAESAKAQEKLRLAIEQVKNQDGKRFSFFDYSTTPEQLAEIRELRNRFMELADQRWIINRDLTLICEEIQELKKIDHQNIDPHSSEPSPFNFMMPPIA